MRARSGLWAGTGAGRAPGESGGSCGGGARRGAREPRGVGARGLGSGRDGAREPGVYVGTRAARGQGQAARALSLAGRLAGLGRVGMAPPPPPPQLLLLAVLVGLLCPSEVRRPAPEKRLARDLKALCRKFVLEGVARGVD